MSNTMSLTQVVDDLNDSIKDNGKEVAVSDLLDAFDSRTYGPILLVPSALLVSPLGAIPTVPSVMASVIVIVSSQLMVGKSRPWLPKFLLTKSISKEKAVKSLKVMRPWFERLEYLVRPRFIYLVKAPSASIIGLFCVMLAALVPPLEVIPLAVYLPAIGLTLLSIALTTRDGVCMLIGSFSLLATSAVAYSILQG